MTFFSDLLSYNFLILAFFGTIMVGFLNGLYSPVIHLKKMEFIGDGAAHAAFGGLGFGLFMGIEYRFSAFISAIIFSLLISFFIGKKRFSENSLIGLLLPLFMALGVVFISFSKGYSPDIMGFLFGNILLVDLLDLLLLL